MLWEVPCDRTGEPMSECSCAFHAKTRKVAAGECNKAFKARLDEMGYRPFAHPDHGIL